MDEIIIPKSIQAIEISCRDESCSLKNKSEKNTVKITLELLIGEMSPIFHIVIPLMKLAKGIYPRNAIKKAIPIYFRSNVVVLRKKSNDKRKKIVVKNF